MPDLVLFSFFFFPSRQVWRGCCCYWARGRPPPARPKAPPASVCSKKPQSRWRASAGTRMSLRLPSSSKVLVADLFSFEAGQNSCFFFVGNLIEHSHWTKFNRNYNTKCTGLKSLGMKAMALSLKCLFYFPLTNNSIFKDSNKTWQMSSLVNTVYPNGSSSIHKAICQGVIFIGPFFPYVTWQLTPKPLSSFTPNSLILAPV